jgi:hypothetical protein
MIKDVKIRAKGRDKVLPQDIKIAEKYLDKAYALGERFFPGIKPKFTLMLCYSRKSYDKEVERKTRRWESGVSNKRRVVTFAPSAYEKLTNNKMSFEQIIIHEVNHIFYMDFVRVPTPQWLVEGIASLVDGSSKHWPRHGKPRIDHLYYSLRETNRGGLTDADITEFYRSSHIVTKRLVRKLGLNGLRSLLLRYSKRPTRLNYKKLFAEHGKLTRSRRLP